MRAREPYKVLKYSDGCWSPPRWLAPFVLPIFFTLFFIVLFSLYDAAKEYYRSLPDEPKEQIEMLPTGG